MSSGMVLKMNRLWQIGMVGGFLWASSSGLSSQSASSPQQPHSGLRQPFAGFDDSLSRAVDTLLISTAQSTPPAIGETKVDPTPGTNLSLTHLSIQDDQLSRSSSDRGRSAAAIRLNRLLPVVEPILRSHGIPAELAAVILVESGGRLTALSSKGARGLWQLMPETARRYGLRVNAIEDDRLDLFMATAAAARYLHDLYAQFGDWKLSLAAYNAGEANVSSAILKAHTQDFDQLANLRMLPLETRNYVPSVLANALLIGQSSTLEKSRGAATATTVFAVSNR